MQHTESSQKIHFSAEYGRFKMMNGNRQLNEGKIKKIIREISDGNDMLKYYPIQVRENEGRLDILDGQHRFFITKHFKRPVFYILVKEVKSMIDIAKVNSNVEKWKNSDFLNCYIEFGNENYKQMQDFLDKYELNYTLAIRLLSTGTPSDGGDDSNSDAFRNGNFEVRYMKEAVEIMDYCKMFSAFKGHKQRAFVVAIYKILNAELYSIKYLAADFAKYPDQLTEQPNYKSYITALELLANVRKHKRVIIA